MNRRTLTLGTALAAFMMATTLIAPPVAADQAAIKFTKKVANDLLAANRSGTITSFARVLRRHADIPGISKYSLGKYQRFLRSSQNKRYYNGVTAFMARYFADQTREYRVAKAQVLDAKKAKGSDIAVNTLVTLRTGNKYTVQFLVRRAGKSFKIADVKVSVPIVGFVSLTYQQRGIFQKFLVKKGGDQRAVNQLVETLNR
ncbi:ABC transporter substrate-binding protein [Anderseniella sp. Alg231-50]|uniref:ABC transporter substrate-binding protein n=1 Tax=Anderseniella sp. Alg231-50 TaxID=1922226 RepID=UPI000D555F3A